MENKLFYYRWFQKVMSIFMDLFFVAAPLASLYVFTIMFSGVTRTVVYVFLILAYIAALYFLKGRIRECFRFLLEKTGNISTGKMMLIITVTTLVIKVIFSVFFNFDATTEGDIQIYNDIADGIIATGDIHSDAISHLYGVALHFVVIKLLGMPLHIGIFIAFYIGTILNFFSFSDLIDRQKAFLLVMLYLLMPSTALLTFCPTHELFLYMYVSAFLFFYNRLIKEEGTLKTVLYSVLTLFSIVLSCFVNPGGYILYIIIVLTVLLSNAKICKKVIVIGLLIIAYLCSGLISRYLNVNEFRTTFNTYTILIHGTNPWSLGEQVDGYPLKQMRIWIYAHTGDFSNDGFIYAAKNVLIHQCIHLLKHPVTLIRLIIHKIYILWSGVHYPIELAMHHSAFGNPVFYVFLALSTIIYLFVFTVGSVFYHRKKCDDFAVSNYMLEVLGVIALTMMCILANKYGIYITLFIYFVAFYRAEFDKE